MPDGSILGVFHPVISVSSMSEAVRYYHEILGLKVTFDDLHDPAAIAAIFGLDDPRVHSVVVECADGSEFELVEFERPRGKVTTREMPDVGLAALALRVTGMDAIVARIRAAGFETESDLVTQVLPDGGTLGVIVCRGPDAVKVILVEPSDGRSSLSDKR